MEIKKLSLYERLDYLNANEPAHPEYARAAIQNMARMPIRQYLGDYAAFCDFQCITEVKESLSYQMTARVIADHEWSDQDMAQILNILATPVLQIEEAYRQKKCDLLPRYTRNKRAFVARMSLAERLEGLGTYAGPPYACQRMPLNRFFRAVATLTGGLALLSVYVNFIRPHLPGGNALFREAVYVINDLQTPERTDLLYKILIEPFAALPDAESEVS